MESREIENLVSFILKGRSSDVCPKCNGKMTSNEDKDLQCSCGYIEYQKKVTKPKLAEEDAMPKFKTKKAITPDKKKAEEPLGDILTIKPEEKPQEKTVPPAEKKRDDRIAQLARAVERLEVKLEEMHDQAIYSQGFYDGRKYVVSQAEEILCKLNKCKTREELSESGKLPAFWLATLMLCLDDPPGVYCLSKKKVEPEE